MKIALILPISKSDYLANTVIDGLISLEKEGIDFRIPDYHYPCPYDVSKYKLSIADFIDFAKKADMIILVWGKNATNKKLAEEIDCWQKTVFVDGSELGKDRRYDSKIRKELQELNYEGQGAIDVSMLKKCRLYFRREKPYHTEVTPRYSLPRSGHQKTDTEVSPRYPRYPRYSPLALPFAIESRYVKNYDPHTKKDIDIACIFGQEDYPILRKQVREYVEVYCREKGLIAATTKTEGFNFDDNTKQAGRNDFYKILNRSKVGISIGGGGFDTARFWEILANNCILFTEKIDILEEGDKSLDYDRIWQFNDFEDFKKRLDDLVHFLRTDYNEETMACEYKQILEEHSTAARVRKIMKKFNSTPPPEEVLEPFCAICKSQSHFLLQKDGYDIYECPKCYLSFVYPQPSRDFLREEIYSAKSGYQGGKEKDLSRTKPTQKQKKLINYLLGQKKGKFLDIGCSSGNLIYFLKKEGFEVSGVEMNPLTANIAINNGLKVKVGTLESAGFEAQSFDYVHMGDLIEHVNDPGAIIVESKRLLRPNGRLIIVTPNMNCFWAFSTRKLFDWFGIPWAVITPPHHLFQFSYGNLAKLLEEEGFFEEKVWYGISPSLKYELGSTHIWKNWKKNRGLFGLLFVIFAFGLYTVLFALNRLIEFLPVRKFSMALVFVSK